MKKIDVDRNTSAVKDTINAIPRMEETSFRILFFNNLSWSDRFVSLLSVSSFILTLSPAQRYSSYNLYIPIKSFRWISKAKRDEDGRIIVRDIDRDRDQYQDGTCKDPNENIYNSTIVPPETNNGNDTYIPSREGDQIRERDRIGDQFQDGTCNLYLYLLTRWNSRTTSFTRQELLTVKRIIQLFFFLLLVCKS